MNRSAAWACVDVSMCLNSCLFMKVKTCLNSLPPPHLSISEKVFQVM